MNYGFTRPRVISRGQHAQFQHGAPHGHGELSPEGVPIDAEPLPPGEIIDAPVPIEDVDPEQVETLQIQTTNAQVPVDSISQPRSGSTSVANAAAITVAKSRAGQNSEVETANVEKAHGTVDIRVKGAKFDWGTLKTPPTSDSE